MLGAKRKHKDADATNFCLLPVTANALVWLVSLAKPTKSCSLPLPRPSISA